MKVIVKKHPETNLTVTKWEKDGKTYGKVRVDQEKLTVSNGFTNLQRRTAFITMDEKTLPLLESKLIHGSEYPIPGKLVVKESINAFWDGQDPKTKGADGDVVLTADGQPIYRDTQFTSNMAEEDILVLSAGQSGVNSEAEVEAAGAGMTA